ncbi:helix-turn-helix transcriptional regulator [Piscinibacter sp. XHJ-5]|uniref:helix-turn-helix transcriptional regulator n=1 Tax=Piscinibacter sp. XHJ-5 TaxID=3037797 RepID=UPI002452EF7F|nr:helix-turn-helix transcriptional regulator [Piscinibacter sp. XHJ-5]
MSSRITILPPSPALAADVMGYVVRRRADEAPPPAAVPSAFPANMYSALTIIHRGCLRDPASGRITTGATFSGAMTREARREYLDRPETTVVLLKPGRLTDLCRVSAHELTDRWIAAGDILSAAERLVIDERMAEQRSVARQIHVLEAMLERRLHRAAHSRAVSMSRLVHQLVWRLPHMTVSELAQHAGLGERQLHRRFLDTFGVSPKVLIRLARLQLSLWHVQNAARRGSATLASVAQRAGFADPAHMARDFKALAGRSPATLHRRMRLSMPSEWAYELPQDLVSPRTPPSGPTAL